MKNLTIAVLCGLLILSYALRYKLTEGLRAHNAALIGVIDTWKQTATLWQSIASERGRKLDLWEASTNKLK